MNDASRNTLMAILGVSSAIEAFAIVVLWPIVVIAVMFLIWVMPQRRFSFSIRTMFVSMTVVALLLGVVVYAARK